MPLDASPLSPLQKAIYERLTTNTGRTIYDYVPSGAAYPYVVIGEDTATDWSTKQKHGEEVTSTLHIWSQYRGKAEVKEIASEIQSAMINPLSLEDGWQAVSCELDMFRILDDPDGITKHGVLRFRFRLYKLS